MDERLRELERRAEAGDPEARARLERERVRASGLRPEEVRLLAYLGDAEARGLRPGAPPPPEDLEAWTVGLGRLDPEAAARAAVAAARGVLDVYAAAAPAGHDPSPAAAVAAAERVLDCPCAPCRDLAREAAGAARLAASALGHGPPHWAAFAAAGAAEAAAARVDPGAGPSARVVVPPATPAVAVDAARRASADPGALRSSLEAALLRWLGRS